MLAVCVRPASAAPPG